MALMVIILNMFVLDFELCLWSVQPEFNISAELVHMIVACSKYFSKFMDSNVCCSADLKYTLWSSGCVL